MLPKEFGIGAAAAASPIIVSTNPSVVGAAEGVHRKLS